MATRKTTTDHKQTQLAPQENKVSDYVLTWEEGGNANTIYVRVSEATAMLFATALDSDASCTNVNLSKYETATTAVALPTK